LLVALHKSSGGNFNPAICQILSVTEMLERVKTDPLRLAQSNVAEEFDVDACTNLLVRQRLIFYSAVFLLAQQITYVIFFLGRLLSIRRFRSTRALWLCLIPGFSPGVVLGIPLAIWALVRLRGAAALIEEVEVPKSARTPTGRAGDPDADRLNSSNPTDRTKAKPMRRRSLRAPMAPSTGILSL
jgi:hypothetical protein